MPPIGESDHTARAILRCDDQNHCFGEATQDASIVLLPQVPVNASSSQPGACPLLY
jgi:hypothetical protein